MQISRTNLAQLIAANFTEEDIAAKLGIEVSAVSEAIARDDYLAQEVARIRAHRHIDNNLDLIEKRATDRLVKAIDFESDPMKLTKIVGTINNARRRSQGELGGLVDSEASRGVVELQLPQRVAVTHKTNAQGEVIEVNGRPLLSKTSAELLQEVKYHEQQSEVTNGGLPKEATVVEDPIGLL